MTAIIVLGFLFRLPGILFYGTYDMDSWVFGWGDAVLHDGLAKGYTGDGAYGILSYAFSALATKFALSVPRFWFLPHKVAEVSMDAATLYLMLQLVPERYRKRLAAFFWLNPLFILHGAWQGYWDISYTFFAVLSVFFIARTDWNSRSLAVFTLILACAGFLKPQGTVYFAVPFVVFLLIRFFLHRDCALVIFCGVYAGVHLAIAAAQYLAGGNPAAIAHGYQVTANYMVHLSDNSINIWYTVSAIIQKLTGQSGAVFAVRLDPKLFNVLDKAGFVAIFTVLGVLAFRIRTRSTIVPEPKFLLAVIAAGSSLLFLALRISGRTRSAPWLDVFGSAVTFPQASRLTGWVGILSGSLLVAGVRSPVERAWAAVSGRLQRFVSRTGQLEHYQAAYLMLVAGALIVSQFGTRAHENHTVSALMLLTPLAIQNRSLLRPWLVSVAIHFSILFLSYGLGYPMIRPVLADAFKNGFYARILLDRIASMDPAQDALIRFQSAVMSGLSELSMRLGLETLYPWLTFIQFLMTLLIIRYLLRLISVPDGVGSVCLAGPRTSEEPVADLSLRKVSM